MSSFIIKIIAMVTMTIDHTTKTFCWRFLPLYALGRIAFPLFAFQTTISYNKTKDMAKYVKRLLIFSIISQIPYSLFEFYMLGIRKISLNIMFTLLLGILSMYIYDKEVKKELETKKKTIAYILKIIAISSTFCLAYFLNVDYRIFGVLLILFIHIFYKRNKCVFGLGYIAIITIGYFYSYSHVLSERQFISTLIGGYIPLIIMLLYNGKKGRGLKYLFYIFYPLHLILLVLLRILVLN